MEANDIDEHKDKDKSEERSTESSLSSYMRRVSRRQQSQMRNTLQMLENTRGIFEESSQRSKKEESVQQAPTTTTHKDNTHPAPSSIQSAQKNYMSELPQLPSINAKLDKSIQPNSKDDDSNHHKIAPSLLEYYRGFDIYYTPTPYRQTYEEFQKNFEPCQVSEQRLKDFGIIIRKVQTNNKVPLQNVSLCDWLNPSQMFNEEIRKQKQNPFTKFMDARLYSEDHSKTYDRASFIVLVGKFRIRINVQNVYRKAPEVEKCEYIGSGSFGYIAKEGKERAQKRVLYSMSDCSKREKLEDVLREYSYMKILACYGYGPGLTDPTDSQGVDITCYQDCITFSMNYCVPFPQSVQLLGLPQKECVDRFERDIKESLLWMHDSHIVHRDIKPDNCMYNPKLGKYVLIDLGISQIVEEGYPQLTITMSCGTWRYMTNELKLLKRAENCVGSANLYEADMYAYDLTVGNIKEKPRDRWSMEKEIDASQRPEEKLQALLKNITKQQIPEIIQNLDLIQSKHKEVIQLLSEVPYYDHLKMVVDAWLKFNPSLDEGLKKELTTSTNNKQIFFDARFRHQIQPLEEGQRQLEFRLRLFGLSADLKRDWQRYIMGHQKNAVRIANLKQMLQKEHKYFISDDSPEEIRLMSGIRVGPSVIVRSYKSILQCKEQSLHWMERVIAYYSLISAQRDTGEYQAYANPNLQKLRWLFAEIQPSLLPSTKSFLQCILSIFSDRSIEEVAKPAFKFIKEREKDQEPYFSDLLIRVRVFWSACLIILKHEAACSFLREQEKIRVARNKLNTPEAMVMYLCIFDYTDGPSEKDRSARQGIKVFQAIWKSPKIEDWAMMDAYESQICGFFLAHIFENEKAIHRLEAVLAYFKMRNTTVSSRMAATQKCLASILMRCGQYEKSMELWLGVLKSELALWGHSSLLVLTTLLQASRLFYLQGDYLSALKRCSEAKHGISVVPISKEYRKKQLEILCLQANILIDMNSMAQATDALNECEKIHTEILKEETEYNGSYLYLVPTALKFARMQKFTEAQECMGQIDVKDIKTFEEQGQYHLARLEIALLRKAPSEGSEQILKQVEKVYQRMGRQHLSIQVSTLLLRARLQQQRQEGDFGETCCSRCIELLKRLEKHPQLGEAHWLLARAATLQGNQQKRAEHKSLAESVFAKQASWLKKYCNGVAKIC